jgi:hypothetical protein
MPLSRLRVPQARTHPGIRRSCAAEATVITNSILTVMLSVGAISEEANRLVALVVVGQPGTLRCAPAARIGRVARLEARGTAGGSAAAAAATATVCAVEAGRGAARPS